METIVRGFLNFQAATFSTHQQLFEELSAGQDPHTMIITCSDSRIMLGLLTQANPGELFVLRNAGNIVPPYGATNGGEGATIEYAVKALKIRHIVVMGHSHCGAMKALVQPEGLDALPLVANWLKHAEATRQVVQENYQDTHGKDRINAAIKENVLVQLDNLRTYPAVAAHLAKGELGLHGWIYEFEKGEILAFDPEVARFVPLASIPTISSVATRPLATRVQAERLAA